MFFWLKPGTYWKKSKYYVTVPPPFPETPEGQLKWLEEVTSVVLSVPGNRGKGVFWWEPAANGGLRSRGYFDDNGNALPVIDAFNKYTRPNKRVTGNNQRY